MNFPQLPPLTALSVSGLDKFRGEVLYARERIISLLHEYANSTGEMKEHYKYVIDDHIWQLSKKIQVFQTELTKELSELTVR